MSGHAPLERDLAELYKARGVRKVVYFHCDHWEPWRSVPGRPMICEPNVEDVQRFVEATQKLDFARKLTLFYKPYLDSILNPEIQPPRSEHAHLHDAVYFPQRTDAQLAMCRRAIRQVSEHSSHEFQVHVHHENYTFNHGHRSEHALDYFSTPECRTYEEDRFALAVNLTLEAIEYESGQMLDRWFFVHGNWALNASDPTVCHIVREIEILKSLGCLGDFTFPAGREHVNPRLEVPYFARPTSEPKGYDLQQSDPQLAYGNGAAAAEKFFIWASFIKHGHASLDYYAPWLRKRLDNTAMHAREIVQRSYCVDGILFIKSHAHSMHPLYFTDGKAPVFPHEDPAIATMFRTLFSAAALAGAEALQVRQAAVDVLAFVHARAVQGADARRRSGEHRGARS